MRTRIPESPHGGSMSFKHRLRTLLLCLPLLVGALGGLPMRPEQIEELMHTMNRQKTGVIVEEDGDNYEVPKLPELDL
jgi:hypothetical protein